MKWSWKLATVAGIGVYVHVTFVLLLSWLFFADLARGSQLGEALAGAAFLLALFGCVVLHELGHALAAKRYGIQTRDITLLPIGGIARLERMPRNPVKELVIAAAGPAVNVAIAAILFLWLAATGGATPRPPVDLVSGPFLNRLLVVNVALVLFNLLPAFPMDGGRILRALLATRMSHARATRFAARVGQGMALLFGFVGLFGNPFLLFIALFVWIGAAQEADMAEVHSALGGMPVAEAMLTDFRELRPSDSLDAAIQLVIAGSQRDFPVMEDGRMVGILTRDLLLKVLAERGREARVEDAMQRDVQALETTDMLEGALARLQASGFQTLPVTKKGRLVGLLTLENIGERLRIQQALAAQGAERSA